MVYLDFGGPDVCFSLSGLTMGCAFWYSERLVPPSVAARLTRERQSIPGRARASEIQSQTHPAQGAAWQRRIRLQR